jgi:hypothetical protein
MSQSSSPFDLSGRVARRGHRGRVHRWTVGRNVLRAFERDGSTAAATGGDLF